MRVLTGVACGILWVSFLAFLASRGVQTTDDQVLLTTAIVVAGGLAGGDN